MFHLIVKAYQDFSCAQKRVALFCTVLLVGMLCAFGVMAVNLYLANDYYPNVTFLFDPRYRLSDFYDVASFTKLGLDVYNQSGPNYFPFLCCCCCPLNT